MGTHDEDDPIDPMRNPATAAPGGGDAGRSARPRSRVLLVIEDDPVFARIVGEIGAKQAFKPMIALRGDVGLAMARHVRPDAIVLDVRLPGIDGWSLLDQFQHDVLTRHIPVVLVSGEDRRARAMRRGAFDYLLKPVSAERLEDALARINAFADRAERALLLVEGNEARQAELLSLVSDGDVRTTVVASGAEALAALEKDAFDCVVIGSDLRDVTAKSLAEKLTRDPEGRRIRVIMRAEDAPSDGSGLGAQPREAAFREVTSFDALFDATSLFLHRIETELDDAKQKLLTRLRRAAPALAGKRILLVDDDPTSVFALKSLLESQRMTVLSAYSGREAIDVLARELAVDVVLMDVMMPEMDGIELLRELRKVAAWERLPVFALTAKAMKGDRERCMEAGASDYIAKPVNTDQLLSLLRVWLGP